MVRTQTELGLFLDLLELGLLLEMELGLSLELDLWLVKNWAVVGNGAGSVVGNGVGLLLEMQLELELLEMLWSVKSWVGCWS